MKVGEKYHLLTALKYEGPNKHGKSMFLFMCECGNKKVLKADEVSRSDTAKATKSCGCLRTRRSRETMISLKQKLRPTREHHWSHHE